MKFNLNKESELKLKLAFSDTKDDEIIDYLKERKLFSAKLGEVYYSNSLSINKASDIILGLGLEKDLNLDKLRIAFFNLAKCLIKNKEKEISIYIPKLNNFCHKKIASAICEGMMHAEYNFDKYKSDKIVNEEITVNYNHIGGISEKIASAINDASIIMEGINIARDLVNEPANTIYPYTLALKVKDLFKDLPVEVKIYDEKEIESIGMHAYLNVAKGSNNRPYLIEIHYKGDKSTNFTTALVGKAVTYDAGGYAIKPAASMAEMFSDMGGSASVIGAMYNIAKLGLKANVVMIAAACENLIDGRAFKNGDIINSLANKTIEILNTDAEGRLTLADAIYYATNHLKADRVIDLATLTGACLVALGEYTSAAISNNMEFFNEFKKACDMAGEDIWLLPNNEYYRDLNKSEVADLKNTGGRLAGTISAGLFIGEFVYNNKPWIHLDIAGSAYLSKPFKYLPKRASGIMVKSLTNFFMDDNC